MACERCKHERSATKEHLEVLHDSQAGEGRHKCAVCAYAAGYQAGLTNATLPPQPNPETCQQGLKLASQTLANLPPSQAGTGRHKCCVCAYHCGFDEGRAATLPA